MKSERRRRSALVSVRFTPQELAQIQAASMGEPLSGYLRRLALRGGRERDSFLPATVNGNFGNGGKPTFVTIQAWPCPIREAS